MTERYGEISVDIGREPDGTVYMVEKDGTRKVLGVVARSAGAMKTTGSFPKAPGWEMAGFLPATDIKLRFGSVIGHGAVRWMVLGPVEAADLGITKVLVLTDGHVIKRGRTITVNIKDDRVRYYGETRDVIDGHAAAATLRSTPLEAQ